MPALNHPCHSAAWHFVWPPGGHFDYSNLGYGILGQVVSDASGKPFDEFLKHDIFQLLGMRDCYLQRGPRLAKCSSLSYDPGTHVQTPIQISDTPGASPARCSSHDLVIFGSFVTGNRLAGQKQIFSSNSLHELLYSDSASTGEKYSFGWDANKVEGYPRVFAQGGTYNSFALLQLIPDQGIAVAVVANTGTTIPSRLRIASSSNWLKRFTGQQPTTQTGSETPPAAGPRLSGT